LPAWFSEHHVCEPCRVAYTELTVEEALILISELPSRLDEALAAIPDAARRLRPSSGGWSVVEYVCHLRDVFVVYTIRLHRARTEDRPVLEPMLNDLRARRFRYNERNVSAILEELRAASTGFQAEVERVSGDDFERLVWRQPDERRTARWLIRQAAHEGVHHLEDIRRLGGLPA
jgi:hypothetical protein